MNKYPHVRYHKLFSNFDFVEQMKNKPGQKGKDQQNEGNPALNNFKDNQKAIPRLTTNVMLQHSSAKILMNYEDDNMNQIDVIEREILSRTGDNNRMSTIVAGKIKDLKNKLVDLKTAIKGVRQSIQDTEDRFAKQTDEINHDFNEKKEAILAESREVEAQLAHYAEWQRQADSFKSHLSELKSTIHHNRVICSEGIAETRQNAQAKIEKHRILLAEAIRQARAESLRLRSGDISNLTTTFLTQSEAHLKSLDSQIESSKHLSEVNQTIDDDNASMQREIDRLTKKNQHLKEQEEKQQTVLAKLKAIKREFRQREEEEEEIKKNAAKREREEKRKEDEIRQRNMPKPTPEFRMSEEQEAFITFLNECATSVRSIIHDMLGVKSDKPTTAQSDRFEAPKLSSMITEIKDLSEHLKEERPKTTETTGKPVLTPAAAYFAFSAPFDESDNFITTENWSFAKYEPVKSGLPSQNRKPRIIRVKAGTKPSQL
ncbi:hypothetical protein TRFO_07515 [Tritrichomonas foetus]|uniref:Uncharacterized protein n=1 Tax=Tritrichomonas foetus TaxID=1144522 RepID=A0A1J4JR71_9EUKA|nr:hypothetical protein TRFO_07515 [Tritrichomonas foetus]|eukprot:OHT01609.1 hypothetical protein TRFO_07515 [Tritrichomonas foetus]